MVGGLDSGNLITGGLMDLGGGSDTVLEIMVVPNTTPHNRLVRWGLSPLVNTCSSHLLSDMRLKQYPQVDLLVFSKLIGISTVYKDHQLKIESPLGN